ncbi:MAG: 3-deoxy-manno-octulosonate cytidylyltransferase [Bacteroidales bacterium]|jgi:3-deoxy-manno-octulosonate cytidylyltransferase (CMP-KDO synthetase)
MNGKNNKIALIPARYDSVRFPGKLMQTLGGKSVILQTYLAVTATGLFRQVAVVTDSPLIYEEIASHGGAVQMSRKQHVCGTDRIAEAIALYPWADIVLNVQGDEPFTQAAPLEALLRAMEENASPVAASLMTPINKQEELQNPNVVKVVTDKQGYALLFSRAPIPYTPIPAPHPNDAAQDLANFAVFGYRHIGVYAFRREALLTFANTEPGPLEIREKLENLRFLENGMRLKMVEVSSYPKGIDTPENLEQARRWLLQKSTTHSGL